MSPKAPLKATLLRDPASDPAHPARALAAIHEIRGTQDAAQLLEQFVKAIACIGADAGLYLTLIPEQGTEPSSFGLFACDPRFPHDQFGVGSWRDHPWLRFAQTHGTAGTERDVRVLTQADTNAVELARRYGFVSCLIVPTPAGSQLGGIGALCLGSDRDTCFHDDGARFSRLLAHALAAELHEWVTSHVREHLAQTAHLSAMDVALLSLQWQGHGSKAISQITGMSVAAVDSRFQRLIRRLDCSSRKAAARRAAEYGLIDERAKEPTEQRPRPRSC